MSKIRMLLMGLGVALLLPSMASAARESIQKEQSCCYPGAPCCAKQLPCCKHKKH